MSPVTITVRNNGPYRVEIENDGDVRLVDHEGNPVAMPGLKFSLCRCGASSRKPFCDGTHSKIGFKGAQQAAAGFDARNSGELPGARPRADGSGESPSPPSVREEGAGLISNYETVTSRAIPLSSPRSALPTSERELDDILSAPSESVIRALARCPGDIIVLGAGGKMGPSLARMLRRAVDVLGDGRRIIAVSRFGSGYMEARLNEAGVETLRCDLLDRDAVARLPDASSVVFMAGQKFGTSGNPTTTWAMNVLVPSIAAERYPNARTVAFSTGNVYGLTPVADGGSREVDPPAPVGEYAQSCVGRERVLEHYSDSRATPVAILRLNYANDLRYGVLTDIALAVWRAEPVDLAMGHVNVIWQGDANARAIQCLPLASTPPFVVNVTGSATLPVRGIAEQFGQIFGKPVQLVGREAPDALIANTGKAKAIFGEPETSVDTMIAWTADWVREGRPLLGKPTHFAERDGAF